MLGADTWTDEKQEIAEHARHVFYKYAKWVAKMASL